MVRTIKKYNRKKIRVRIDGIMYTMYFKTAMKAIKKSHKAYFAEDGHVELESLSYSLAGDDQKRGIKQEPFGNSNEPITHDQRVGAVKQNAS